jgi:glycosyltransferase involved in cell wall biosynthesis
MLQKAMKWGAFYSAEVFILPSHQENFGIAVAEALGCGLPVLISDKVNIWREVAGAGAGAVAPDSVEGTTRLLTDWLRLSAAQRQTMAQNARRLFDQRYTVSAMAQDLLDVIASS